MIALRLVVVLATMVPVAAQTTWTVNRNGGAQFTTIQAAVGAASDGDLILVDPVGLYDANLVTAKGITIMSSSATPCAAYGTVQVVGLPAGRQFVLRKFTVDSAFIAPPIRLLVSNCSGLVVGESLALSGFDLSVFQVLPAVRALDSQGVMLHDCLAAGRPAVLTTNTPLTASQSQFRGNHGDNSGAGAPSQGLIVQGSRVQLTATDVFGGSGEPQQYWNGVNAMECVGSQVDAVRCTFTGGTGVYGPDGLDVRLDAASSLRHDAAHPVSNVGGPGAAAVSQAEFCAITGFAPAAGGSSFIGITGPFGGFVIVIAGLPAGPIDPLQLGLVWVDLVQPAILQVGTLPQPPLSLSLPPTLPRGLAITLQGALSWQGVGTIGPPLVTVVQ